MLAALSLLTLYLYRLWPTFFHYPTQVLLIAAVVAAPCIKGSHYRLLKWAILLAVTYLLISRADGRTEVSYAFAPDRIVAVEGKLVEDSALTRSELQVVRVKLRYCSIGESGGSAGGVMSALIPIEQFIPASSSIYLTGTLTDDPSFFVASDVQVLEVRKIADLRRRIIFFLERRLQHALGEGEAKSLAVMLLLGQSEAESFFLKDLAVATGCAHTLALSGMHLSFFCTISVVVLSTLVGKRRARRLGLIPPTLFVGVAGPKPSLIRSLFFRLIGSFNLGGEQASIAAFLVQLLLYPEVVTSMAALYSWAAFSALLLVQYLPKIPLVTTAMAIAATAPASLLVSGTWNPMGLLYAPMITLLVGTAMGCSLFILIGGRLVALPLIWVTEAIASLMSYGAVTAKAYDVKAYGYYLLILLTSFAAIGYAEFSSKIARRRRYEMGVRIRLTQGNQHTLGREGVCDDQEVWTKLSPLHPDSPEDCEPSGSRRGPDSP